VSLYKNDAPCPFRSAAGRECVFASGHADACRDRNAVYFDPVRPAPHGGEPCADVQYRHDAFMGDIVGLTSELDDARVLLRRIANAEAVGDEVRDYFARIEAAKPRGGA